MKRSSPELNWESWDQTDLEYEDEKALERRRQLLQRELELQMRQEETERRAPRHITSKQKKVCIMTIYKLCWLGIYVFTVKRASL